MRAFSGTSDELPRELVPGKPTGDEEVVAYRLEKLGRRGIISGRWLDCGCSDGSYTVALYGRGADSVVGCDVDSQLVESAQNRWRHMDRLEWVVSDAKGLPFRDTEFDGVLLNEVLEHISEQEQALSELYRVVRPGGYLCVFSPNRWFPFEGHGAIIGSKTFRFPIPLLPWLPHGLALKMMRARNYWPSELTRLVSSAGFDILDVEFAFPVLNKNAWLPKQAIRSYRSLLPTIENLPLVRRFGMSTVVFARRPR